MAIESDAEIKEQEAKAKGSKTAAKEESQAKTKEAVQEEQAEVVEPEKSEVESSAETSDESDPSQKEEVEPEESEEEKPSKLELTKNAKKRIDKLVKERAQARQEVEYWKSEAIKQKSQSQESTEASKKNPAAKDGGRPKAENFEKHEDFIEALTDWKIAQRDQVNKENEIKAKEQNRIESYKKRAQEFAKDHSDWNDVVEDIKDIPLSMTVYSELLDSENGPELYYELAKNPDELRRICSLGPISAARELGKFEASLSKESSGSKAETKKITTAPKPPTTVGTKSVHTKSIYAPDISQHEFERLRADQIKERRKRA